MCRHDTCAGYNGEPADECGVGVLSKGNCIRNSTTVMSAALARLGAAATPPRKIVYYIDHGNPTSPQKLHNPKQYYIADTTNGRSDVSKVGTFRLNFHRFDRFELHLRGHTQP